MMRSWFWLLVLLVPSQAQECAAGARASAGAQLAIQSRWREAEAEFRAAVETSPECSAYLAALGRILAAQARLPEAASLFEQALRIAPKDAQIRRDLAVSLWQGGRFSAARANLQRNLEANPADRTSILLLGMVCDAQEDYGTSARLLASIPELVEQRPEALAALARSQYRLNQTEGARSAAARLALHLSHPADVMAGARAAADAGDYETAEKLFRALLTSGFEKQQIEFSLALVQFRTRRYEQCQTTLLASLNEKGQSSTAYGLLAWCYWEQKKSKEGLAAMQKAIALDPSNEYNYLDLGAMLIGDRMLPAALEAVTRATERVPNSFNLLALRGLVENKLQAYAAAVNSYSAALRLKPESVETRIALAGAQWMSGMHAESEAEFDQLIRYHPGQASIYEAYGVMLLEDQSPASERAVGLLEKALALDNSRAEAHYQLGNLILVRGSEGMTADDCETARRHLEAAARLDPAKSRCHYALSRLYRRMGRKSEAEAEMSLYQEKKLAEQRENPRYSRPSMEGR